MPNVYTVLVDNPAQRTLEHEPLIGEFIAEYLELTDPDAWFVITFRDRYHAPLYPEGLDYAPALFRFTNH